MSDYAFLAIPVYAGLNRLHGARKPDFQGKKAVILALAVSCGYLVGNSLGVALGALWWTYRSIPMGDGVMTARTVKAKLLAALWHLAPLPLAYLAAQHFGGSVDRTIYAFAMYAVAAWGLAVWYGRQEADAERRGEKIGDENVAVEIIRGACFGLAMMCALS